MQKDSDSIMIPEDNNEAPSNSQEKNMNNKLNLPQPNIITTNPISSHLNETTHITNIDANISHNSNDNSEEKSQEDSQRKSGSKGSSILQDEESKDNNIIIKGENNEAKIIIPISKQNTLEERKSNVKREPVKSWRCRTSKEYVFETIIGKGTFGRVFKAKQKNPKNKEEANKVYALKMFKLENEKEGFPITGLREISYLKKLNHKNIVQFKEIITEYGT